VEKPAGSAIVTPVMRIVPPLPAMESMVVASPPCALTLGDGLAAEPSETSPRAATVMLPAFCRPALPSD